MDTLRDEMKNRKPVECTCLTCKNMCRHTPCVGTPDDIKSIIDNGYGHRLIMQAYVDIESLENILIYVGIKTNETGGCPLQNTAGLCTIHGKCKPTEGRLANCATSDNGLRASVLRSWIGSKLGSELLKMYYDQGVVDGVKFIRSVVDFPFLSKDSKQLIIKSIIQK